jgi:hypothetical protein
MDICSNRDIFAFSWTFAWLVKLLVLLESEELLIAKLGQTEAVRYSLV